MIHKLVPYIAAVLIFVADRLSKAWIDAHIGAWDNWVIIPGFFSIIHAENRGMAFSLLADWRSGWREVVLVGVAGVVLVFVSSMVWQTRGRLQRWALTLVMGGAAGNLFDRAVRGTVTDFLDFYIGEHHWPTFNVADSAITVGAILLGLELLLAKGKESPSVVSQTHQH
jgi:signal peptidase II